MENQITLTQKWVQKSLAFLFVLMLSVTAFAQPGGGGGYHCPPGGGHGPGGGHPGGPHHGGGGPHPGGPHTCNAHFFQFRDSVVNGVRFFNLPGTGAATYAWDFGDGSTSTDTNPSHTYADTGLYNVCLTITDTIGGGCTDTYCDTIHVFTPAPHCNANFRARGDSIANEAIFHSSHNSPGATYSWDFGDGNTSTDANPTNTYAAAGTYWVCLTVTNTNAGGTCTDTHCDSVNTDFPHHGGPHHPHHFFKLADGTSVEGSDVSVSIYPNPMVEKTTVHIENTSGNVTFNLYGMNGQVVMTKSMSNGDNEISKENLTEGLYFYSIDDNGSTVGKGKLRVY